jgi:predicted AAA+ superfamily ATPase
MIKRDITQKLEQLAQQFPVVAVVGPRQSGKTTITQMTFGSHAYVSLEEWDVREFAQKDPRGFLDFNRNEHGIILDEIQNAPSLLSYIQTEVDRTKKKGFFVISGSQNFLLNEAITQTLAGRVAILTLLPLSLHEIKQAGLLVDDESEIMYQGCYPRIYADGVKPIDWYPNYIRTYIERDVRQIKNVSDLSVFQRFMKLCAGRIGQLLNISSLANDCSVSVGTAKAWLSLMEASYIIFMLHPHYKNFSKRLIKSPKLYFYDTGLASYLLEIETAKQLSTHYLRGGLFESFIVTELMKGLFNKGLMPHFYFWRDKVGHEVDCIIERAGMMFPIEIKAGKTITQDYFAGLNYWNELTESQSSNSFVVYAGSENQTRTQGNVVGWQSVDQIIKHTEVGL